MMTRSTLQVGLTLAGLLALPLQAIAQDDTSEPTQAQPKLQTQMLTILSAGGVSHQFSVELARTPREQQVGLMFRTFIPADSGMLFIWPTPQQSAMWMENCPVPEDMLFVDDGGVIAHIAENTVPESLAQISSGGPVRATIELQGGITAKLDIKVGDHVRNMAFDQARTNGGN